MHDFWAWVAFLCACFLVGWALQKLTGQ